MSDQPTTASMAQARELAPNLPGAHISLGLAALARRRNKEAEAHFRNALAIDPENAFALNNLGVAALRQGRRNAAIAYFADASRIDPQHSKARRNAVNSVGTRAGMVVSVYLIFSVFRNALSPGLPVIAVLLAGLGVVGLSGFIRATRGPGHTHDDPVASKELIRALRREAGRSGSSVRVGWLLRGVGVFVLGAITIVCVLALAAGLASLSLGILEGSITLAVGATASVLLLFLVRRPQRQLS